MYSNASQYLQTFGTDEAAQLLCDEESLLDRELLLATVNEQDRSSYSAEEKAAGDAALERLLQALEQQTRFINTYLRGRYTLPLSAAVIADLPLDRCCAALARWTIAEDADNRSDSMEDERKHWMEWLRGVRDGKNQLDPGTSGGSEQGNGQVISAQGKSRFNWQSYP